MWGAISHAPRRPTQVRGSACHGQNLRLSGGKADPPLGVEADRYGQIESKSQESRALPKLQVGRTRERGGWHRREQRQQPSRMSGAAPAVPGSPPEALEQRTMHVFISRALHKILREAPKKHTQLRAACQEVIGVPTDP